MRPDDAQQTRSYTGDPIQSLEARERSPGLAIRDDGLGQGHADAGQPGELRGRSAFDVDPLAIAEWPSQRGGAVAVGLDRMWRERGQQLD
jgi:hypothetical protein